MAELKMSLGFGTAEKRDQTTSLTKTYKFHATIHDFQKISRSKRIFYQSSHTFFDTNCVYKWIIIMYSISDTSDYFSVCATLANENLHVDNKFMSEFSILDGNGKKNSVKLASFTNGELKLNNFISKTELSTNKSTLLVNNQLRLLCRIFDLSSDESPNDTINSTINPENLLLEGFDRLFSNEKFSDFKLAVKGKEFNVHRAILAARSPVFEAMFESNMRETSEKKVVIDDIEPEVAEKMLRFVYTGEMDFGNLAVEQVLITAEKYQLDSLKLRCENKLAKGLDIVNVYDILLLADQNNAAHLRKKAIEFFDKNVKTLVASEDFKTCVSSLPPDLRTEIIYISALNR